MDQCHSGGSYTGIETCVHNVPIFAGCFKCNFEGLMYRIDKIEEERKAKWELLYKSIENVSKRVSELERLNEREQMPRRKYYGND